MACERLSSKTPQTLLLGISSFVPAGAFFAGNSCVSFPFISELVVGEEENSLTPLPVLDNSSSAAKWFAFQQWETALCNRIQ